MTVDDDEQLDRETAWIHFSERELIDLCARVVPESVLEKAQQMRLEVLDERMKANAVKPRYRKRRKVT